MTQKQAIQPFEEKQVRTAWDNDAEKWWFSVVDVVSVLTDSDYQLKFQAPNGKMRLTDIADTEQLFRLIQSIPSPKAEPFMQRMAQVVARLHARRRTVTCKCSTTYSHSESTLWLFFIWLYGQMQNKFCHISKVYYICILIIKQKNLIRY